MRIRDETTDKKAGHRYVLYLIRLESDECAGGDDLMMPLSNKSPEKLRANSHCGTNLTVAHDAALCVWRSPHSLDATLESPFEKKLRLLCGCLT